MEASSDDGHQVATDLFAETLAAGIDVNNVGAIAELEGVLLDAADRASVFSADKSYLLAFLLQAQEVIYASTTLTSTPSAGPNCIPSPSSGVKSPSLTPCIPSSSSSPAPASSITAEPILAPSSGSVSSCSSLPGIIEDPRLCIICLEAHPRALVSTLCSHSLCISCLNGYVASKLQDRQVPSNIPCPETECTSALTYNDCEPFLMTELREAWVNFLAEENIPQEQKVYCPFQSCSVMLIKEDENMLSAECPSCNRLFCVRCMVPWHSNLTCEEYNGLPPDERANGDLLLHRLANDNRWRRCSQCRRFIELTHGCHHMTCRCC